MPDPPPEPEACRIARGTLDAYFTEGRVTYGPEVAPEGLDQRARVAVSLFSGGDLRGCMVSRVAVMPTAAREIAFCAIQAATTDPMHRPVHRSELPALQVGVAVFGDRRLLMDGEAPVKGEALEIEDDHGHASLVLPGCGGDGEARMAAGIEESAPVRRYAVSVTTFGRQP